MLDLLDPVPRPRPVFYAPYQWPDSKRLQLPPQSAPLVLDIVRLIGARETRRGFTGAPGLLDIGSFLWLACRSRSNWSSGYGPNLESRSHPSAGALYPIHVLASVEGAGWSRYEPISHALIEQRDSMSSAAATHVQADEVVKSQGAMLLALVAEPGKTSAKYKAADTLLWRDAGVILGYMSIVAEALGLGFCPLGPTGNGLSTHDFEGNEALRGVGLAWLGAV